MFGHLPIRQITRYTEKEGKEENKKVCAPQSNSTTVNRKKKFYRTIKVDGIVNSIVMVLL